MRPKNKCRRPEFPGRRRKNIRLCLQDLLVASARLCLQDLLVEPPPSATDQIHPCCRNDFTVSDQYSMCSGSPSVRRFHSTIGGKARPTRIP